MKKAHAILTDLITNFGTARDFSRHISEDSADVIRWKNGDHKINARAVIKICRLFPEITPYSLNRHVFPKDLQLIFGDTHE